MKNKTRIILLASALSAGIATPALAAWDNIGNVFINHRPDRDSKQLRLGGSVEKLSFRPSSSDVTCRAISVRFANGRTRTIFSGTLYEDRRKDIDLPGASRNVRRIDFNCVARDRSGTRLDIAADIGRYRDEWRRDPEWARIWSRMFGWAQEDDRRDGRWDNRRDRDDRRGNNRRDHDDRWILLDTKRFTGRNDRETIGGQRGINRVALKPNRDARCQYVVVTFANGNTRNLGGARLYDNRYTELDLPGARRNVSRITLHCQGIRNRNVSVGIYGIRDR